MAAGWGRWQAYEKTSIPKKSYPSVARFTGRVQFKGVRRDSNGEHTRPACRGGRPRPPIENHPAQPHISSSVSRRRAPGALQERSRLHRIRHDAAQMDSRRSAIAPTVAAQGSISRFAERWQVFRAVRKTTRGARALPIDCPAGGPACGGMRGENRRPACPAGCPTRCRCLGRNPLQGYMDRCIECPWLRHPAGCRAGQPGRLFSPALAISAARPPPLQPLPPASSCASAIPA